MAKQLKGIEFVHVHVAAASIAEAAIVAYYMEARDDGGAAEHHARQMLRSFDRLCEVLGVRVVDAATHRMDTAADRNMIASARHMIPTDLED